MKLRIVSPERTKQEFILAGEREYLKRFPRELKAEVVEGGKVFPAAPRTVTVLLDERGKALSSAEFAKYIEERMSDGLQALSFGIGPADGWTDEDRGQADFLLGLSRMTFTYQMTRLILIEQLYRAVCILKGTPYHR